MIVTAIPLGVVALGAVALAAVLFALDRLRARPRVVRLAGAPLWQAALAAAPRRVLTGRFERWLAYLLALAIAWSLWGAFARPERPSAADGRRHVFFLDASAGMTAGDRFAAARRALLADVATVPAGDREVVLGGPTPIRLLAKGEALAVLRGRLATVSPGAYPSVLAAWLRGGALASADDRRPVTLHHYGFGQPVAAGAVVVAGYRAPPVAGNRGIVALGVSPAASGAADRADVLIRTAADGASPPGADALRFTLDGAGFVPPRRRTIAPDTVLLPDVAAAGGRLRVELAAGDGFAADDVATIALPDRRPVRVAIAPGVPAAIARAVTLDPGARLVAPAQAQVVVRRQGDATGGDRPALVLTDPTRQAATFAITDAAGGDPALARALEELGVADIDGARMADDLARPVAVAMAAGSARRVAIWSQVFAPDAAFAQSRAMPLFVSRSLRWLAAGEPWIAYAAAGRPLPGAVADAPFPLEAGALRVGDRTIPVSLTDPAVTRAVAAPVAAARAAPGWGRIPDPVARGLLLAAVLLLGAEWWLLVRRRIA